MAYMMQIMSQESISVWAVHRKLYEWVLSFAKTKIAIFILFAISIIEAFMPFVPPDVLLVPMCIEKRSKAACFALVAIIGSLLGALIGYFIIASMISSGTEWLFGSESIEMIINEFEKRGSAYVFIAALTPVPFFALTVAAGVAKLNIGIFLMACIVGRSLRYSLVAFISCLIGDKAKQFIEKWFNAITVVVCVTIVLGWYLSSKV